MARWRLLKRFAAQRHECGWTFALLAAGCFALVQGYGHFHHEMWRDELHCWGMGRAASGLWDVLTGERKYDGHPFLWYYLLHLASRVSRSYLTLHVIGIALASVAQLLWLRYAPLPRWLRLMLPWSYYAVYEYGVISRGYTLGIALLFGFCAAYHPYRIRYALLATLLALLAATSMYGTCIAIALGLFLFSHGPSLEPPDAIYDRVRIALPRAWLAGLIILAAGLGLTALTTWPPADARFAPGMIANKQTLSGDFAHFWMTLFPYQAQLEWNWLWPDYLGSAFGLSERSLAWLGAGWLGAVLFSLRGSPRVLLGFALGIAIMVTAQHVVYPGGLRHLGHYFVLWLACVWLHARERRGRAPIGLMHVLLALTLTVQIATGFAALRADRQQVFSSATATAQFIRTHQLQRLPIVADPDHPASGVAIALDRPFFFAATGETSDFVVAHNRYKSVSAAQLVAKAVELAQASGRSALIVVNYDLSAAAPPDAELRLLYRGPTAVMNDECFRIYRVDVRAAPAAPSSG